MCAYKRGMASKTKVAATPERRKDVRKEEHVNIRLTADQKAELLRAANHVGIGLSPWMLIVALREARKANAKY